MRHVAQWCKYKGIHLNLPFPVFDTVMYMVYCSNCGEKLPENSYFCLRCGVRTEKGLEAGMSTPWEDLRDAFARTGEEIEKAFSAAGKEMEKAFKVAKDKIREATSREPVTCSNCGGKNAAGSRYCQSCGTKLKQESV